MAAEDNPADYQRAGKCDFCKGMGLVCPSHVESATDHFESPGPGVDPDHCAGCGCDRHEHTPCPDCNGSGLDGTGVP